MDERFYHPTGAESYYYRKKKFKKFLHFFYNVSETPGHIGMKRSEVELTALHQEYETLGIWKRRLRWVGGEVIEAVGGHSALRLDPET
ncbi:MAG: hypothetical protein WBP98_13925, partial [Candidatus Sulfotelmatobacter sp.]